MPDENIMEKLGKIKAHMESAKEIGNEAEADAFAGMLNRLLMKHKLEMTDIQYEAHVKDEPVEQYRCGGGIFSKDGKYFYKDYPDVEVGKRRIDWVERLAGVIARAHSCAIMVSTGTSQIWFVGQKSNAAIVDYLFAVMMRTAERLAHKEYMKLRRKMRHEGGTDKQLVSALLQETHGYKASFLDGFITRLYERFEEEKRKMEHDNTGTALMRINKEALAVQDWFKDRNKCPNCKGTGKVDREDCSKCGGTGADSAKNLGGRDSYNTAGYSRGKQVADSLNLKANAMNEGQNRKELK